MQTASEQTLEERVTLLEEEIQRLNTQIRQQTGAVSGKTAPDFLARFAGIFGDDPTFEGATRLGRAWREGSREKISSSPDA